MAKKKVAVIVSDADALQILEDKKTGYTHIQSEFTTLCGRDNSKGFKKPRNLKVGETVSCSVCRFVFSGQTN